MVTTTERRPEPTFDMLQAGIRGGVAGYRAIREVFGQENYDEFRDACEKELPIPEESRLRVDRHVHGTVGRLTGVKGYRREVLWKEAMKLANSTINYTRGILFADQERKATLTTNIAWDNGRPSSALERLTTPTRFIGEQCRYEQGRQLWLGSQSLEVLTEDENGHSADILHEINNFLEREFFIGRKGDPDDYSIFSYHIPGTNKLIGFSNQFPDSGFREGLWVKSLDYPVRQIGFKDSIGKVVEMIPALYDPDEKSKEAWVIKGLHRSLKAGKGQPNATLVETLPYGGDRLRFRLVIMEGEHPLRDKVTSYLQDLFEKVAGYEVEPDDEVDPRNGSQDRFKFKRIKVKIPTLKRPLEVIVQTLSDYVAQLYEVGSFNPAKGMHDGPAHDLYKLETADLVSPHLWPPKIFGIDLSGSKKSSSYEYATRLGRKQRIYPSPYDREN